MKILLPILCLCLVTACAVAKEKKEIVVDDKTTLIDVRTAEEFKDGHLETALNIPHTEIKEKIAASVADKKRKIIVYCRSGRRSGIARTTLLEMGYKDVTNAGGYSDLKVKIVGEKSEK